MTYFNSLLLLLFTFISASNLAAQMKTKDNTATVGKSIFPIKNTRLYSKKGGFFIHWGYNFANYTKSNIHFTGQGYDFTLKGVSAADRPSKLDMTYIRPKTISIPQFNFHIGYNINDTYSVSIGWDHMKYVADIPQTVKIDGYISNTVSEANIDASAFAGTYNGEEILLTEDFLTFEHTDGYNFASVAIERNDDIWVAKNQNQSLAMETGIDLGLLIPRSDVRLFGTGANHYWNVAGWGASAKVGAKFFFTKRLYLQGSLKFGFTNLTNIYTTGKEYSDRAKQNIGFFQQYIVLGFII